MKKKLIFFSDGSHFAALEYEGHIGHAFLCVAIDNSSSQTLLGYIKRVAQLQFFEKLTVNMSDIESEDMEDQGPNLGVSLF